MARRQRWLGVIVLCCVAVAGCATGNMADPDADGLFEDDVDQKIPVDDTGKTKPADAGEGEDAVVGDDTGGELDGGTGDDVGSELDAGTMDAGVMDTGPMDTGVRDTGPMDTGPRDTGAGGHGAGGHRAGGHGAGGHRAGRHGSDGADDRVHDTDRNAHMSRIGWERAVLHRRCDLPAARVRDSGADLRLPAQLIGGHSDGPPPNPLPDLGGGFGPDGGRGACAYCLSLR